LPAGRAGYQRGVSGPVVRLRRLVRGGRSDAPGRVVDALGRVGLVGYGLVHVLVAWLGLQLAFRVPEAPADAGGAVGTVARTDGGFAVLALTAVGLASFALWQVVAAAVGFRWVSGGERVRKRVGAVSKSIAITALAVLIVEFLRGVRSGGGDSSVRGLAATVLALPAGRLLLGALAATVLGIAVAMVYTGVQRTFLGDLDLSRVPPPLRRAISALGVWGHLARAIALGTVGVLIGLAALSGDPQRAGGIDAALRTVAGTAPVPLALVAGGFAAFGLFCLADAATRRA
jgi:hypothetical protein